MSTLLTEEYLAKRSKRGSRRKFKKALGKVKNIKPDDIDALEDSAA